MNRNEVHGGLRYAAGKVEKTAGDVVGHRDWQVAGVIDQVAGGAEHAYGRARSVAADVADAAPHVADKAGERIREAVDRASDAAGTVRERAGDAAERALDAARRDGRVAADRLREAPAIWATGAVAAGVIGYALGWLIHGRRD